MLTYKHLALAVVPCASLCVLPNIAFADATALNYALRSLDKGNAMESTWNGGYLKVNFSGTTMRVKLLNEGNVTAKIDTLPVLLKWCPGRLSEHPSLA